MPAMKWSLAACLLAFSAGAAAQSTLGELLDKGGKKVAKEEYLAAFPANFKYVWPNRQGEADLHYTPDGKISGSEYHYHSQSTSPATGTWTVDEVGKWCASKSFSVWNTSFNGCFFGFRLGEQYFFAASDSDRDAKLFSGKLMPVKQ